SEADLRRCNSRETSSLGAERLPMALSEVEQPVTAVRLEDAGGGVLIVVTGWDQDQQPATVQMLAGGHEFAIFIPEVLDEAVQTPAQPMLSTGHIEPLRPLAAGQADDVAPLDAGL